VLLKDAIAQVLAAAGQPLHVKDITARLLDQGLWQTQDRTPAATVAANLLTDIKANGRESRFVKAGRNSFGLSPSLVTFDETAERVVAHFEALGVRDVVVTPSGTSADVSGAYELAAGLDVRVTVRLDAEQLGALG
jgi:hypothetical protein